VAELAPGIRHTRRCQGRAARNRDYRIWLPYPQDRSASSFLRLARGAAGQDRSAGSRRGGRAGTPNAITLDAAVTGRLRDPVAARTFLQEFKLEADAPGTLRALRGGRRSLGFRARPRGRSMSRKGANRSRTFRTCEIEWL